MLIQFVHVLQSAALLLVKVASALRPSSTRAHRAPVNSALVLLMIILTLLQIMVLPKSACTVKAFVNNRIASLTSSWCK